MKVICLGNYLPRQCGIATFTVNLVEAILHAASIKSTDLQIEVIAMNDHGRTYDYPARVVKTLNDQDKNAYADMADYINRSGAQVCLLQHEYGIFGGASGVLLLRLLRELKIPIVTTCHTVLQHPAFHEREVLKKIGLYSSKIVIMNGLAIGFLKDVYAVPESKICRIQHGVPDFEALKHSLPPAPDDWNGHTVMLTFGLIGRSKGIETAINAMPLLVKEFPDLIYVVLGKTHPNVVRFAGEEYREMLKALAERLGVSEHIRFIDRYLTEEELMAHLLAADLYVTPYHNKAQITSGTLSYAVAGGCAVFSTPYWHAEELLADGRGNLFGFGNYRQLAAQVAATLNDRDQLKRTQQKAYEYGKSIAWPLVGQAYIDVLKQAVDENGRVIHLTKEKNTSKGERDIIKAPPFDPAPLLCLTDDTGILQHANGNIPCYKTGYCLDDNTRALILSLMACRKYPESIYEKLAVRYLSYIKHMHIRDGVFINYFTYDRRYIEWKNSDDAYGRTLWALGYLVRYAPNDAMMQVGLDLFYNAVKNLGSLCYARGFANSIFGLYHYSRRFPDQERFLHLLVQQANALCEVYKRHQKKRWNWFEDRITYDNGLLPASLYMAWECTGTALYLEIAEESTAFLESKCLAGDHLNLIGNKRWLGLDENYEIYAQQPIDAMAMIVLYDTIYSITASEEAAAKLRKCFLWFLGKNDLELPLYDPQTKGCNDGIEETNINRNQGAESNIAWLMAHIISEPYFLP